jgi:hypothetical protein
MSRAFEIAGKDFHKYHFGPHSYELKTKLGSLLLQGAESWEKGKWWCSATVMLYPDAAVLRTRLTALEADPAPIKEIGGDYSDDLPEALAMLRDFVETYETAFKDKTEWEDVYLWKRDENRQIVRDEKGEPVLAQEEPIARQRLPVIMYY